MIVTFFGHSDFRATKEYEEKLLAFLEEKVGDRGADMYLGGYGEFDSFAYSCCKKYKETHKGISLIFVTPYITLQYQRNHLDLIKDNYDLIIYPEIEGKPLKYAITYRNRWMVERSDALVCGIDHSWGGAYKAYKYAKNKKRLIFNLTGKEDL